MNKLKELREASGISRMRLAEIAEVSARTLEGYEQNKKDINGAKLKTILKICRALNCRIEDILDDEETLELFREIYGGKMMKYYVMRISNKKGFEDEFTVLVTEDKEKAIKEARDEQYIEARDNNGNTIEIRVYDEDIEDEDCTCFDYNTIEF